jgi:hypothetical protein
MLFMYLVEQEATHLIEETNEDAEPKVQEYVAPVEGVGEGD